MELDGAVMVFVWLNVDGLCYNGGCLVKWKYSVAFRGMFNGGV